MATHKRPERTIPEEQRFRIRGEIFCGRPIGGGVTKQRVEGTIEVKELLDEIMLYHENPIPSESRIKNSWNTNYAKVGGKNGPQAGCTLEYPGQSMPGSEYKTFNKSFKAWVARCSEEDEVLFAKWSFCSARKSQAVLTRFVLHLK